MECWRRTVLNKLKDDTTWKYLTNVLLDHFFPKFCIKNIFMEGEEERERYRIRNIGKFNKRYLEGVGKR